jgi:hypothetical protein
LRENQVREGDGLCVEGDGLVGSFLSQEDGETNRRWVGRSASVFDRGEVSGDFSGFWKGGGPTDLNRERGESFG